MPSDPRLMALPALRKLAEEQARDLFVARYTDAARGLRDWAEDDNERELCIRAHLTLLCDLSRPASRDAVARLVAEALGLECGATAPGLFCLSDPAPVWWIDCIHGDDRDSISRAAFGSPQVIGAQLVPFPVLTIPGISSVTDPAEALTMVAVAVLADSPRKPAPRSPVDSSGRPCHDPGHVNMWHCDTCDAGVAVAPATRVEPVADLQDDDGEWIHDPDMGAR